MASDPTATGERVERALADEGLALRVGVATGRIELAGPVETDAERDAAIRRAQEEAGPEYTIVDRVEVAGAPPDDVPMTEPSSAPGVEPSPGPLPDAEPQGAMPGDFTSQEPVTRTDDAQRASVSEDEERLHDDGPATADDRAYVPPIDPVGTDTEVIGGTQQSSLDSVDVAASSDGSLGDEAIRDAVLRELREDAATHALEIDATVHQGVVTLHGRVRDLDDAESAEEVAARVPGVHEVFEDLEVANLERGS